MWRIHQWLTEFLIGVALFVSASAISLLPIVSAMFMILSIQSCTKERHRAEVKGTANPS